MNRFTRLAVVPAATLVFGTLLSLSAPAAHAACYSGTPFTGTATGYISSYSQFDYWNTESAGVLVLRLTASDTLTDMHVYGPNCESICQVVTECVVTMAGTISIYVHDGIGAYTLTATPSGGDVDPLPPGSCNVVNTAGVCVNIATGTVIESATVREVELGTSGSHTVVGKVEQWRFPLPTGGSVVLPCVVLTANGLGNSGCSAGGGTYVGTTAVLVDDSVDQPSVGLGDPILTVGVCEAEVTITAAGFGVEDFPLVSLC